MPRAVLAPLLLSLPIVAVVADARAETIRFQPQADVTRTYALEISEIARPLNFLDSYVRSLSVTMDVATDENTGAGGLHLTPSRVALTEDGSWTRSGAPAQWSDELEAMQRAGYFVSFSGEKSPRSETDADGGRQALILESAAPEVASKAGPTGERLTAGLNDPFASFAFPVAVEAEAGWTTTISRLDDYRDVSVTVDAVGEDRIHLSFEGGVEPRKDASRRPGAPDWQTSGRRIAGLAVLDRRTGWVLRQVTTRETMMEIADRMLPARRTVVLAPLADGELSFSPDGALSNQPADLADLSIDETLKPAVEAQVFAADEGYIEPLGAFMLLGVPADVDAPRQTGKITFGDIELKDGDGKSLDLNIHAAPVYTQPDFGSPDIFMSAAQIRSNRIGPVDFLDVAHATARVSWYPPTTTLIDLTPDETGHATVERDGVRIDLRPGEAPDSYILRYAGQADDFINWETVDETEGSATFFGYDRGPEWLSPAQSQVRSFASSTPDGQTVVLKADRAPTIRFRLDRPSDEPQAVREIGFVPRTFD